VTKATTFTRRRGPRPPEPYVTDRGDGRFDVGCRACGVVIAGMVDREVAEAWASNHRCADLARSDSRSFP
jgi:hypothetical protein